MKIITNLKFSAINKSSDKSIFYNLFCYIYFFIYIKMSKTLSGKYCEGNKEIVPKKACQRYQNISKGEKEKKPHYSHEQYKNLSEDEKLVEYRKNYYRMKKKRFIIIIKNYYSKKQCLGRFLSSRI